MVRLLQADFFLPCGKNLFQVKIPAAQDYSLKNSRAGALAIMPASASI